MLKFLRKIRKNLTDDFQPMKNMRYAIGEIILVVIGILIAIQLNEWNQNRIEKKQYSIILENLENEFNRTKKLITTIISDYTSSKDANTRLMQQFSANRENLSAKQIDTLIERSTKQAPFYPLQPILDELLNSGKIKSLPNQNLKLYLFDWESNIKWFHFDYDLFIHFSNDQLTPYLNKHWSWKNIDIAGGSQFFEERSLLKVYPEELFEELEFENLIDSNLFHTDRLFRRLTAVNTLIDKMLMEIETTLRP